MSDRSKNKARELQDICGIKANFFTTWKPNQKIEISYILYFKQF